MPVLKVYFVCCQFFYLLDFMDFSCVFAMKCASVKLTNEYGFHLIRVDEKAYVASAEVSLLMWEDDLVRTKVSLASQSFSCCYDILCFFFQCLWISVVHS